MNSLDLDLPLRRNPELNHFVAELKLKLRHLDCYSAHLDCGNLSPHQHGIVCLLVDELRLGISTVFCACWTSDAASQQARLPLNSGTALVEPPLSSELPGWSVPGVASQPGTPTIQLLIRFEMRSWKWSGPLPLFLPRPVVRGVRSCGINRTTSTISAMTCGTYSIVTCASPSGRNHQRLPLLLVNVLDQWDVHCFLYPLNHRHLSLHHHRDVCSDLSKILLGRGKDLLLIKTHRVHLLLLS